MLGGILTGVFAVIPFVIIGTSFATIYRNQLLLIPFLTGAMAVFVLIQIIVCRKKFQTLRNFYLLSAVVSLGVLIILFQMILSFAQPLIVKLIPYFESDTGDIIATIVLYIILGLSICVFVLFFGLITRHKSAYIGTISDAVKKIAENGADIRIEEKGHDELTVLSKNINQMNADLQKNRLQQQKAERQKNELISNVSHDLRSPLTSIIGYMQLLQQYSDKNDQQFSQYIEVADRKLQELNTLINELFELTKMDSPDFKLNVEQGDVTAFIKQFSYEMISLLQQNELCLVSVISDTEFVTAVDFEKLVRVMENLFSNVLKYAQKKTDVILETSVFADSITISLSNTVKDETKISIDDMFNRFYREDYARTDTDSAGLGLAIAKKIIELHNGEISAKLDSQIITITIVLYKQQFPK